MRRAAIALVIGLAAVAAARDVTPPGAGRAPATEPLMLAEVYTTPGKPMELADPAQPAEQIIALRHGSPELFVIRNVPPAQSRSAPLTDDEWRAIERVVAAHGLATWRAAPTGDGRFFDYSTSGFALARSEKATLNAQRWSQPVAAAEHPQALFQLLARLARDKVKSPELRYLTP